MGDPVWLPDVLRAAGLTVNEYPGWRDRGHGDFGNITHVICHHTGSFGETPRGIAEHPSLGLASQLYLGRDGAYTICGVGIAWHAGAGSWPGIARDNANQVTIGIEAANDGGGTPGKPHRTGWSDAQYNSYVRGVAAILKHLGLPADRAIGHKEWAGPSQGKWDPGAIDMDTFRADVARAMANQPEGGSSVWGEEFKNYKGVKVSYGFAFGWIDKLANYIYEQFMGVDGKGWKILGKSKIDPKRDNTLVEAVAELREDVKKLLEKDAGQ